MSMLGTFHPRRHKTQRYVHVFVSSLEFDLSWQMASSCLGTDFGCGHAVEDGSLLFVDQPHSQIQLGLMNMNDSQKQVDEDSQIDYDFHQDNPPCNVEDAVWMLFVVASMKRMIFDERAFAPDDDGGDGDDGWQNVTFGDGNAGDHEARYACFFVQCKGTMGNQGRLDDASQDFPYWGLDLDQSELINSLLPLPLR